MSSNGKLHIVIGASGGVGSAVARILWEGGKSVRAINRSGVINVLPEGMEVVAGDAMNPDDMRCVAEGAMVVYHCAHPKDDYSQFVPMTENIIDGAESSGAKLVMANSMYAYGKVDEPMTEDMPHMPVAPSGEYHARAAELVMDAHEGGRIQTTIGRASNYFGPNASRMWPGIDTQDALAGNTASVIGNVNMPHTYTYVDDFARDLITLGDRDEASGEVWHVPNAETITTREFMEMMYGQAGSELKVRSGTRIPLTLMSWFNSQMRDALEVLYQFEKPFIVDHSKYEKTFGADPTPNEDAIAQTLDWFRENSGSSW
jgi:nucleoside-diphosphate-sugar epimerase